MEHDTEFSEFMAAFEDDYQIEENPVEEQPAEESEQPSGQQEQAETQEDPAEEQQEQTDPPAAEQPAAEQPADETFTLKINKEEKTYSREEVISLAQKGADYDRVKEQLAQSRSELEELAEIAKESGKDIPSFLNELRKSMWKSQGLSDDAIAERELRVKAEKENERLKAKPADQENTEKTKARKEIEEFRKLFPAVVLTDELLKELSGDVVNGASLTSAYMKREIAAKDAKIAELEKTLEAEKQNKANRASSPGSQQDSGGKRTKSEYDEFMEAFA